MKPRALTDEEADELYREYCQWQEARRNLHPKKLAAKHGICRETMRRYINERRRAA